MGSARGTVPAAKTARSIWRVSPNQCQDRGSEAVLLTWGFHHYFHGKLTRADLDQISATRPIIVWHRSAHEFILNSATMKKFGVTQEWFSTLKGARWSSRTSRKPTTGEQGAFAVMPLIASAIATPDRLRQGLEFVEEYFHANGITRGCEPGGLLSKPLQDAQNAVLSDPATPFRFYFIADGKSLTPPTPTTRSSRKRRNAHLGPGPHGLCSETGETLRRRRDFLTGHAGARALHRRPQG